MEMSEQCAVEVLLIAQVSTDELQGTPKGAKISTDINCKFETVKLWDFNNP